MIKKSVSIAIILLFVITLAAPAYCDTRVTKLGRGLANILTFPLEIPEQITRTNNTDGPIAGSTVGLVKGIGCAIGRMCVGVFEATTFLFPYPKDYQPILKDPEYFMETSNF